MLIRSQDGVAYNLDYFERIEVRPVEAEGVEAEFRVKAVPRPSSSPQGPMSHFSRSMSEITLGTYTSQEEADQSLRGIVKASGGIDLVKKEPEADELPKQASAGWHSHR